MSTRTKSTSLKVGALFLVVSTLIVPGIGQTINPGPRPTAKPTATASPMPTATALPTPKATAIPSPTVSAPGGPPGFTYCSDENGVCSFSGTGIVAYGVNGSFVYGVFTNTVNCNNSVFGDPAFGFVKACYYQIPAAPLGFTLCSPQDTFCTVLKESVIAYGANGSFNYKAVLNGSWCNNAAFGDPAPGVFKACFYASPVGPPGYTVCSVENVHCAFNSGTGSVAYGANGAFNYLRFTNGTDCNNSVFGDPAPGVVKACFIPRTIAFASTRSLWGNDSAGTNFVRNIWVVRADGSGATPLTLYNATGADSSEPEWSPDGTALAFSSSANLNGLDTANTNDTINIWKMNADGSGATPLTWITAAHAHSYNPVWDSFGQLIVFTSRRALDRSDVENTNGTSNIWVVGADGSSVAPVTKLTAAGAGSHDPTVARIVLYYVSSRALDCNPKCNHDAANTNFTENIWFKIGYGWADPGDTDSSMVGTGLTTLSADSIEKISALDGIDEIFSSFAALDGSDAANPDGSSNIWGIHYWNCCFGYPLTHLTTANASHPSWLPNAKKIAYDSDRALDGSDAANIDYASNIWVMNADGSKSVALTKLTQANCFDPVWSPDGGMLAFISDRALDGSDAPNLPNYTYNIWVMNADGSGASPITKLTASGADSYLPRWRP